MLDTQYPAYFYLRQGGHIFISVSLFVTRSIFTKVGEKLAHRPRKKPLDFGSNLDHDRVMVKVRLGSGLGISLGGFTAILCTCVCKTIRILRDHALYTECHSSYKLGRSIRHVVCHLPWIRDDDDNDDDDDGHVIDLSQAQTRCKLLYVV